MAITESEMRALREMYLDVAGSLLESERRMLGEIIAPVERGLVAIEQRLGVLERRMGIVETQLGQLVRLELVERRLAVVEASVQASEAR